MKERKAVIETGRGGMIQYQEQLLGRGLTLREKSYYPDGVSYTIDAFTEYKKPKLCAQFKTLLFDLYDACEDDLETVLGRAKGYFEGEITDVKTFDKIITVYLIDGTHVAFRYKIKKEDEINNSD